MADLHLTHRLQGATVAADMAANLHLGIATILAEGLHTEEVHLRSTEVLHLMAVANLLPTAAPHTAAPHMVAPCLHRHPMVALPHTAAHRPTADLPHQAMAMDWLITRIFTTVVVQKLAVMMTSMRSSRRRSLRMRLMVDIIKPRPTMGAMAVCTID